MDEGAAAMDTFAAELLPDECEQSEQSKLLSKIEKCLTIGGKVKVLAIILSSDVKKKVCEELELERFNALKREHLTLILDLLKSCLENKSLNTDNILGINLKLTAGRDIRCRELAAEWEEYIRDLKACPGKGSSISQYVDFIDPFNLPCEISEKERDEYRRDEDRQSELFEEVFGECAGGAASSAKRQLELGRASAAANIISPRTRERRNQREEEQMLAMDVESVFDTDGAGACDEYDPDDFFSPQRERNTGLGQNTSPQVLELEEQIDKEKEEQEHEEFCKGSNAVQYAVDNSDEGPVYSPPKRQRTELCPNCNPAGLCEVHAMFNLNLRF